MNKIVLIRHVDTDLGGTFCGSSDPDLNAAGQHRLRTLLDDVAPLGIERIYSSDLRRASQTAMAIGKHIGVPVELRPSLREIHFGLWEGLRWEEVEQHYPHEAQLWVSEFRTRSAPGGEAYQDFSVRVEAEFKVLIADRRSATFAIVTHRGVIVHVLTRFFGFSEDEARKRTKDYGAIVVATQSNLPEVEYTTSELKSEFV